MKYRICKLPPNSETDIIEYPYCVEYFNGTGWAIMDTPIRYLKEFQHFFCGPFSNDLEILRECLLAWGWFLHIQSMNDKKEIKSTKAEILEEFYEEDNKFYKKL